MEKALAWLDDRLRRSRLVTDEDERLTSVWCHLADITDQLPKKKKAKATGAVPEAAVGLEQREDKESNFFDDIDDLGLDWASITDSLNRIVIPNETAEPKGPLFFQASEGDRSALQGSFTGVVQIGELAGEDPFLPLRALFLRKTFAFVWEGCFPKGYHFEDWLNSYRGTLEWVYHERHAVVFSSGKASADSSMSLLTDENMQEFSRQTKGYVRIGLPYPLLMLYPLRMSVLHEEKEDDGAPASSPEVLLLKDNLTRKTVRLIEAVRPHALLVEGSSDSSAAKLLQAYAPHSYGLNDLQLDRFFRLADDLSITSGAADSEGDTMQEVAAAVLLPLELSPSWRIQAATWLRNPRRSWDEFNVLFTSTLDALCNDWWINTKPDDTRTIGVVLGVGDKYQEEIFPKLIASYQAFIKKHPEYGHAPEQAKQKLLETTGQYLNQIVVYLDEA